MRYARYADRPLGDSVVDDVTGWLTDARNQLQALETQITRIENGVKGGVTGAQVGYASPTNWKPLAIGAGVIVGGYLLLRNL